MPTLTEVETQILRILGDPSKTFWTEGATDYIVEGIQHVSEMVVKDALHALTGWIVITADGSTYAFSRPSDDLFPMHIEVDESDGEYLPWTFRTRDYLTQLRRNEQNLMQDSSNARFWTYGSALTMWSGTSPHYATSYASLASAPIGYETYPTPESSRTIRMMYIKKPAESGTLDSPNQLLKAIKEYAISVMATKKSRDIEMANLYDRRCRRTIQDINARYFNVHGMSSAVVTRMPGYY